MSTTTCKKRKPYKRGARNKTTKTSTLLKDYFNKNNIIFYQRTAEQNIEVFLVPYDIQKQDIKLHIRIIVIDDINLCNMSFSYELNKNTDYSKELLDMNSKLVNGRLSVEKILTKLHMLLILDYIQILMFKIYIISTSNHVYLRWQVYIKEKS